MATALLGGGCFWCLEAVFEQLQGVSRVTSGYAGGGSRNPSYEAVCSGLTGHAEVVELEFDPAAISYRQLLEVFFAIHDPTTPNRQGADVGTQYRSVVFTRDDRQRDEALALVAELEREAVFPAPIVTQILDAPEFFPAEAYHQGYFRRNPAQGYCSIVVAPKVAKARHKFNAWIKQAD